MRLEGSCHCGAIRFAVQSRNPYPFNLCYCSICRKTAGAGGFAINLGADADSLEVTGDEHLRSYSAVQHGVEGALSQDADSAHSHDADGAPSHSTPQRKFCGRCGSALWLWDPTWPELIHPHASAIDTPLPIPPERTHMMLGSKAHWVEPCIGPNDRTFDGYPDESLADWHKRLGLER